MLAAAQNMRGAMAQVEVRLHEGMSLESILLDFIAPAARLLGEQWLDDDKSFAEVTLGLGTLHRLLATLRHRFRSPPGHRGLVVLLAAPGEQHTLAIHVLGDLLSHAGWEAVVEPKLSEDEVVALVASQPVVMVGISVSCSHLVEPVGRLVARVRECSLNRELIVMVGGALDLSSYAEGIGALHCPNARTALSLLERQGRISL
jgi:methanogenic corrinoid protein MtbC1